MSDAAWSPPDSDFKAAESAWSPPESDFAEPKSAGEQKLHDLGGDTWGDDPVTQQIHAVASGMYHGAVGGYKGIGQLLAAHGSDAAADAVNAETAKAYQAPDSAVGRALQSKYNPLNYAQEGADAAADWTAEHHAPAMVSAAIKSLPAAAGAVTGVAGIMRNPTLRLGTRPFSKPPVAETVDDATPQLTQSGSRQSMGAAKTLPDMTGTSPELQQAATAAGPNLHDETLQRHINAETLPLPDGESPMRLTKGQATRDEQQVADEYNMRDDPDTQKLIRSQISDQSKKLGQSIGEIQRRATPDTVARTTAEHDQTAIDAIKSQDNDMIQKNRAAYKELSDANGGALPIDKGALGDSIDSELQHEYLTDTVNESKVLRPIMADIRSPSPLTFQRFESIRTRLAEVMREGGSDGAAAKIVRSQLESMPLTDDAAALKGLANKARAGAKERFDWIDQNPAVEAAINDNVPKKNGLHVIGAPSPQAGGFLDRFATGNTKNASPALVDRLKQSVNNPDLHEAIEGATLNKLRETAGIDPLGEGTFKVAPFSKAVNKLESKAPLLLKPETLANINHLKNVAEDVAWEGAASGKNRSNTGSMLARFGALPTVVPESPSLVGSLAHMGVNGISHVIPGGRLVHAAGDALLSRHTAAKAAAAKAAVEQSVKDAKLKFAQDAVKPGAGIDYQPPTDRIPRARGGRAVPSDDELVERLIRKWKQAKKATNADTKSLLHMPDESIVHALKISGAAI